MEGLCVNSPCQSVSLSVVLGGACEEPFISLKLVSIFLRDFIHKKLKTSKLKTRNIKSLMEEEIPSFLEEISLCLLVGNRDLFS